MRVHTQAVHFSADEKLLVYIEKRLEKLSQFFDKIVSAEVFLKLENSGQVKDKIAEVKIEVPGNVIVTKVTNKTFEAAIKQAVETLKRQLIRHKEKEKLNLS